MTEAARLSAVEIRQQIDAGDVTAEAITRALLEHIASCEKDIGAFAALDAEQAIAIAAALDAGPSRGPLHGVPIVVKDIMATCDLPTGYGSPIYQDMQLPHDAAIVALARRAGAIVLGKSVTTEFAYFEPGSTRNPRDLQRTPGGSSSGSAAAVAARMAPLGLGTQTAGSIIRPASYCGVIGFKPSFGLLSLAGVKSFAPSFDTAGVFARSVADAALLVEAIGSVELGTAPGWAPKRIGVFRQPAWPRAEAAMQDAFEALVSRLARHGCALRDIETPLAGDALSAQMRIMAFEAARELSFESDRHAEALSEKLKALIAEGWSIPRTAYAEAQQIARQWRAMLDDLFRDVDILITPSAPGIAPLFTEGTGDPVFNRIWTLAGTPAVNVPGLCDPLDLPLGVQVIAAFGADRAALTGAAWLEALLQAH